MEISKIPTTVRNVQGWYEKSMVRKSTVRKVQKWYETSMVRIVYGTKSPAIVGHGYSVVSFRGDTVTKMLSLGWGTPYSAH